ncbi:hypothetical protein K492DRAFT_164231 [Lichtheimia hyalospora FSU 10163]|nr:hypothetical protein K492DRAFT_164231 [Lichtheimia hyalospora FSU 10163]
MILTPETVASYLPTQPDNPGRIINVSHQIPYNIIRKQPLPSPPLSPPDSADVSNDHQAPISKISRRHNRAHTLRAKFDTADWRLVQRRGHAALYSGLASLGKRAETIHIGWTGHIENNENVGSKQRQLWDQQTLRKLLWDTGKIVPIFLDTTSRGHYEGYCKEVLWPLFHYVIWQMATDGRAEKRHWEDYKVVNQRFADTIIQHYRQGDVICIHDYHLLLVPELVREVIPDAVIGLFFHATFPSSEIFRCLTTRKEILQGVLGANLVGFQTYGYARHFISSCTRVLGCESTLTGVNLNGHHVSVGVFPIGIDVERVRAFCEQPQVMPKMESIRRLYPGKHIIVGRDKLDPTKGIVQKLRAFQKFLELYPEYRQQVVLLQVTTPTPYAHHNLDTRIAETVSQINSTYGSLEFAPVHYYQQDIDRDEYYAMLSVADVGLITSVRDGMNTTSLEYIYCQQHHHGPLILSEFTGTAGILASAALQVNPWDEVGVAKAIHDALTMSPEEKQTRHEKLFRHVTNHTAAFWANSFVTQLMSTSHSPSAKELIVKDVAAAYTQSKKRLLLFDYDGTLTPIVNVPADAKPAPRMLNALQKLCNDPANQVWVISGRDQATLDSWLGDIKELGFSAEHGCYVKWPGATAWEESMSLDDMRWRDQVTEIFDYYTERTQGSFIEHKRASITWHYRLADAEYGEFQAKECQNHLENNLVPKLPIAVLIGKKNIEVRPVDINKGVVVQRILSERSDIDLVICAGDDRTDEDMFSVLMAPSTPSSPSSPLVRRRSLSVAALQHDSSDRCLIPPSAKSYCITVGPYDKKSLADHRVESSDDIVALLERLAL